MTTPFRLDFTDPTRPTIEVDGTNLAHLTSAVYFTSEAGELPQLVLVSRTPAEIAGVANVTVEASPLVEDIANRVRAIDADALRAAILADPDSTQDVVAATIEAVASVIGAPDD